MSGPLFRAEGRTEFCPVTTVKGNLVIKTDKEGGKRKSPLKATVELRDTKSFN